MDAKPVGTETWAALGWQNSRFVLYDRFMFIKGGQEP